MNASQRKHAGIAYACYLFPTAWFLVLLLLVAYQSYAPEDEGTGLLVMWFVLLPFAVATLGALLVAFFLSLTLRRFWSTYPGLFVVPLALLPLFVVLVLDAPDNDVIGGCAVGAYMLSSSFFCLRWFLSQRSRVVLEAPPTPVGFDVES